MNARLSASLALFLLLTLFCVTPIAAAQTSKADEELAAYFRAETARLSAGCLDDIKTAADWENRRGEYRRELFDMLGLWPIPEKTDLKPVVTGTVEHDDFVVEKLHYQSLPGLYVTGNLYRPKNQSRPLPAVLYVCGHGPVVKDGVSYGNKVGYQHHGAWFARNGYVCLLIDTIQLGEIQGIHHGTYREKMWWWNSRGYTPAGVEAWNSIRALDYLAGRPEVDASRMGVTGRSGGGAYSWWLAALDERIKCAAPVAGITDLQNHVVDGCVEGHCDCMFFINTYRWDYPLVAALVSPRPLLLANSDKDSIFPLDGVERLHAKVARIYALQNASDKFGLLITEGPHKDTQDLQLPVFRWFNRHLKGEDPVISMAAEKFFEPEQLKVFASLPANERTSKIHDTFVPTAPAPQVPQGVEEWNKLSSQWLTLLREKTFRGWPEIVPGLNLERAFAATNHGMRFEGWDFTSQEHVRLRLYTLRGASSVRRASAELTILDADDWPHWLAQLNTIFPSTLKMESILAGEMVGTSRAGSSKFSLEQLQSSLIGKDRCIGFLAPRGIGLGAWSGDEKKQTQIRRRFMLLGQTLDGMRVWDIQRGLSAMLRLPNLAPNNATISTAGSMAVNALYASLFLPEAHSLKLANLPGSLRVGPDYLNAMRVADIPAAIASAASKHTVTLNYTATAVCDYAKQTQQALGWPESRISVSSGVTP